MKKKFLGFAAILGLSVALFSCSDDDKNEGATEYPLSTESNEKIREYIASNGETLLKSMESLADDDVIKVLLSFASISDRLENAVSIKDPASLAKFYGKYTWDAEEGTWGFDNSVTDKAVFIFPKEAGLTANDAKIEATATDSNVRPDDKGLTIPKNVSINIYTNDKKIGDIAVSGTNISETTLADAVNVAFNLGNYVLTGDIKKNGTANDANFNFSVGGNAVVLIKADLAADVSAKMFQKEDYSSMKDGNFSALLGGDLNVVGYLDGAKYATAMKQIGEEFEALYEEGYDYWDAESYQAYLDKEKDLEVRGIEAYSKNMNLILASVSQEKRLADAVIETKVDSYKYTRTKYVKVIDEDGYVYYQEDGTEVITYYDVDSNLVLKFGDGVEVDADVYFSKGFDKVINAAMTLMGKFGF